MGFVSSHPAPAAAAEAPGASRPRVIVAEDDAEMRRLLASTLAAHGYEVTGVDSGPALLAVLRRFMNKNEGVAMVVSDVRMPGCSGLHVLRALRAAGRAVPVILITAFGDEDVVDEGQRAGAACVLSKPFDLEQLLAEVGRLAPLGGR